MKRFFLALVLCLLLASPVNALTLAWDTYTDPDATGIRIYHSTNGTDFALLIDNIPTDKVAVIVPDGTDYTRVYYVATGFNETDESVNSNMVSFMWSTGGSGSTGVGPVDGIHLLDCDTILLDPQHADYALCNGRFNP